MIVTSSFIHYFKLTHVVVLIINIEIESKFTQKVQNSLTKALEFLGFPKNSLNATLMPPPGEVKCQPKKICLTIHFLDICCVGVMYSGE
jgi:hypothetical protein